MRRKDVKIILGYYSGIVSMTKLLDRERAELENQYNGLRSAVLDGAPHGSQYGKPAEELVVRLDADRVWAQIQAIHVKKRVLEEDAATIRACLDALSGKYKNLLSMRWLYQYSWANISVRLSVPEGTVRRWHNKALDRMGEALDEAPMIDELSKRASCARV